MALTTSSFDILSDFPGWVTSFDLMYRQEQSRTAGGQTVVKDHGSPLWQLKAQSKLLRPNLLDYWRARLTALENGLQTFYGYPLSRTYPILYPNGSWPTGGAFNGATSSLFSVNANNKAIRVGDLPAGFTLKVGDYVSIAGDLHQVMEAAVASGDGLTPEFEVRPRIWPGVSTGVVLVYRPACIMALVPGSLASEASLNGWGTISFQGVEAR